MTGNPSRDVLAKVRKLALLPDEARESKWAVSVTRLTTVKSLCKDPEVANRFATYLARKTVDRVAQGEGRSAHPDTAEQPIHRELMLEAVAGMEAWLREPTDQVRQVLRDLLGRMKDRQNQHRSIPFGAVRLIDDWDLLLCEKAASCLTRSADEAGYWCYVLARDYAERYHPGQGTGLTKESAAPLTDIIEFWIGEFDLDPAALASPGVRKGANPEVSPPSGPAKKRPAKRKKPEFTHRQGQFLAYIHLYRKLHRRGPAESDLVKFFRVTPPSVHGMIVKLEELGLITREPGVARSARAAIPEDEIPPLEGD